MCLYVFQYCVGLASFDVTAIQSYSPQSSNNKPLPPPLPVPLASLPPPSSQPLPKTDPARPLMQPYSFRSQQLDPIQEESRSYYSSSSGSTTCSSKNLSTHSNVSRSANISQHSQHNEDEEPPGKTKAVFSFSPPSLSLSLFLFLSVIYCIYHALICTLYYVEYLYMYVCSYLLFFLFHLLQRFRTCGH